MKIVKIIYKIIIAVVILFFIITVLSVLGLPQGFRIFTVMSGSMSPAISEGSVIFVIPQNEYQTDEIITFEKTDNASMLATVTHRVTEINYDEIKQPIFTTKGDANQTQDMEPVYIHQVIGKVVLDIPLIGYPISFAKTKLGVITLVLIPALVFSFFEFNKMLKDAVKEKKVNKIQAIIILSFASLVLLTGITLSRFSDTAKININNFNTGNWEIFTFHKPENKYINHLLQSPPLEMRIIDAVVINDLDTHSTDNY